MKKLALLFLALSSTSAFAAQVGPCMGVDDYEYLVKESKLFDKSKIRISHIDTDGKSVGASHHIMVQVKIPKEEGYVCFLVSDKAGDGDKKNPQGWAKIEFEKLEVADKKVKRSSFRVPVFGQDSTKSGGNVTASAGEAKFFVKETWMGTYTKIIVGIEK